MPWRWRGAAALAALLAAGLASPAAGAAKVATSTAPVHALVAGVMDGVGTPTLIGGRGSPHLNQLRPSEVAALREAEVVIWVGPALESFLARPLASLDPSTRVVTLSELSGMKRLPARDGGIWPANVSHDDGADGNGTDPHLWLDPENARRIVAVAEEALAAADPANRARYAANAAGLAARIAALDHELENMLAPVRGAAYVVLHDAYQYFEARYGLGAVGAITVSPDRMPSAKSLTALRARLVEGDAHCVFGERGVRAPLVATLVAGTGAGEGTLDPIGEAGTGADGWFTMMRANAAALVRCLAPAS